MIKITKNIGVATNLLKVLFNFSNTEKWFIKNNTEIVKTIIKTTKIGVYAR